MKTLLLLLFLTPAVAFSQCPNFIGQPVSEGLNMLQVVEKYMELKMPLYDTLKTQTFYGFYDSLDFAQFKVSFTKTKTLNGLTVTYSDPRISKITIYGPAERINRMIKEYFEPLFASCKSQITSNWIFWEKEKLVIYAMDEHNDIPMKKIVIEKQ